MKKIEHEIKIQGALPSVYEAMTTRKGLESWHSPHISGDLHLHGQFSIEHESHPPFCWKITQLHANKDITWECTKGPGNSKGTHVIFNLKPCDDGRILVHCTHQGWEDENSHFTRCNTLWGMLLSHLKHYVETGNAQPALD